MVLEYKTAAEQPRTRVVRSRGNLGGRKLGGGISCVGRMSHLDTMVFTRGLFT
jgi:hypothetical protein